MIKEFGYEYDAVLNEDIWKETKGIVTDEKLFDAICLRSGRDALKAVAREYEPCVTYLPALACDSMVHPFEQYGHTIRFYNLKSDYSIDLSNLVFDTENSLFLYMDYFGRPSINDDVLVRLRTNRNIVFIEDRTHSLIWERNSTFQPDYIMASLRKWIAIPDGGLLWGKISQPLNDDTSFSTTRLEAQCMRNNYLQHGDEALKKKFRKIFSSVSDIMDHDDPCAMSAYSYAIAKETKWDDIRSARKANAETLISILQTSPHITFIQNKTALSDLYVAFMVANRDEVQNRLSEMGIFNTIIWPLTVEQRIVSRVAKNVEDNMLAAPCDQRYTIDDMEYIGLEMVRIIEDVNR